MQFTSEQAYRAHKAKRPIMISQAMAGRIMAQHDVDPEDAVSFAREVLPDGGADVDAWAVLSWLGY